MNASNNSIREGQEASCQAEDDPFNVDKLIVDYDYVLYKILDQMESIQMKTTEICRRQHELVERGVIEKVIDKNIAGVKELLEKCEELEKQYDQLAAVNEIAETFNIRLKNVANKYREYIGD